MFEKKDHPKTPREYLRLFFTGFAMGSADIVPGVSGGTMAFILGVYEDLIDGIKSFDLAALRLALGLKFKALLAHIPWQFLFTLGIGILTAVFTLSHLLSNWLENHPLFVFAFFGGLIIASILAVSTRVTWKVSTLAALAAGAAAAYLIVGLNPMQNANHEPWVLFLSGMVAICAMILPGISGSFILLILGQYAFVLSAVRDRDIISLAALALGCMVGIVIFSRILSWLLHHHEQLTVAVLIGFMLGSLRKIWEEASAGANRLPEFGAQEAVLAIALIVIGFLVVSSIDHLQSGNNPVMRLIARRPAATE
jgi:putative membrane protein